jgi:hypothetical protein
MFARTLFDGPCGARRLTSRSTVPASLIRCQKKSDCRFVPPLGDSASGPKKRERCASTVTIMLAYSHS